VGQEVGSGPLDLELRDVIARKQPRKRKHRQPAYWPGMHHAAPPQGCVLAAGEGLTTTAEEA
jgi:hypothetical protein